MSIPLHVSDGDFLTPAQNGDWDFEMPFIARGESPPYTFIARRKMRADQSRFAPQLQMTAMNFPTQQAGTGYFVDIPKGPYPVGQGLIEWEETWASLPQSRVEYEPVIFPQAVRVTGNKLVQITERAQGKILYDYSIYDPLPPIPKTYLTTDGDTLYYYGGLDGQDQNTPDVPVIVNDAMSTIWMGRIFERRTETTTNKKLNIANFI